ncbi:MAG: AMP-binding protein [Acidimicrobiales bacterium]
MRVPLTIGDFLERAALVYPERVAAVDEPGVAGSLGRLTYAELHARARGMAAALDAMGVGHGERVAILSPNSAQFLVAYFGVSGFGRVLVPINYRLNAAEIAYIVEHSGSAVVLVDPECVGALEATSSVPALVVLDEGSLLAPGSPERWEPDEDATASINYTSGTTARPKGVQLTHRNCWLNAAILGWHTTVSDRDVLIHTLPMFHCNGWGMPYALTAMGGRHVVLRKVDGEEILRRVEAEGVTLACGAPSVVSAVLDAASARRRRGQPVPGRLTSQEVRIVVAGAPPPSKAIERVETELGWELIQLYGLTETSPTVTLNRAPFEYDAADASERSRLLARAGVPAVGVRVRTDGEGEALVRSNLVFEGYWRQPAETADAIRDGWFHTGDGGYMDGPCLVISDRKKDVVISGGENVSSIEVEDCLYQHPAVAEVAVIGVPDERWGETVKALVVLRPGVAAEPGELVEHCRARMAHFKCPTSVELRESLPRTATGKLQKFVLREPYWVGHDRAVG